MYDVSRSTALLRRMRQCDALVGARPGLFFTGYERLNGNPVFVEKAQGPHLWDVDGNRYLDFLLGFGSVVLGHAHPAVNRAVEEALRSGVNPTLLSLTHLELAERLVELIPSAEQVTFLKTGSDAVGAAVRLSRAVTGREIVLHWGGHGWHDWCASGAQGIPKATTEMTVALRYNDIDHARELFARHKHNIACVVMMPYEIQAPVPGYLQAMQQLARQHGALFVLDEVRSGFRIALGGAQDYFGLDPDLTAFGKALANGHALSVLAGRRQYMSQILKLGLTVTYYRSPDAMAAALATLDILQAEEGPARLAHLGTRLMNGLGAAIRSSGVQATMVGFPATPFIHFDYTHPNENAAAMRQFCNGMLRRGVLMTPAHHWFVCTAMSDEDIDFAIEAAAEAFADIRSTMAQC